MKLLHRIQQAVGPIRSWLLLGSTLFTLFLGCGSDKQEQRIETENGSEVVATRDINAILADHDDELIKLANVVGVAVGELDDHTPCLLIMLSEDNAETRRKIPAKIEGHPTKIVVSGEIKPL